MRPNCCVTLCLLLLSLNVFATGKKPVIEKEPAWVRPTTVNYTANSLDDEAQDGYSDLHFEKQISLQQQAVFQKTAVHILSEAGVQNQSKISVDYDPSYQSLIFHSVRIIRNGKTMDKLQLSAIKTIQQEKELDKNLYNGSLTAVLILDDVRKGDVMEYSYTLRGFNPIFKNKYSTLLETGFGVPVYKVFYRLLVPKQRQVNIKNSLTEIQPAVSTTATETVYEWEDSTVRPVPVESNTPSWHDPYPMIMISEFENWGQVIEWASELFPFSGPLSDGLKKQIAAIKAANPSQEAQILSAIRFVQDDVRYMGIEMGVNSHKPHAPSQIFTQRFGDCKDKAYLLCTILKALGVEAYPVLNNTYFKKAIRHWLPMPRVFDHATVCIRWNNQSIWIDPTISYQRGPLTSLSYPDYQTGLVIQPGATGLTGIPLQESGKTSTKEVFSVKRINGPVRLEVTTRYSGSFADDTRYRFHTNSLSEIKKDHKNFYLEYFKKLTLDSLAFQDEETTGVFTTKEYYTLKDFWTEKDGKTKALLHPFMINGALKRPAEDRAMPFSLTYPLRHQEEIEVRLPEEWSIEEFSTAFRNSAFALKYRYTRPEKDVILLTFDYENLSDHIAPEAIDAYLKDVAKVDESAAFELYKTSNETPVAVFDGTPNNGFTVAYVVLGICALATYVYKRRTRGENRWE